MNLPALVELLAGYATADDRQYNCGVGLFIISGIVFFGG